VEDGAIVSLYGDTAYLAALTQAQMIAATTPDAPNSTRAADWVATMAGAKPERDVEQATPEQATALLDAVTRLIDTIRQAQPADVVDGDVV
jgi:hypothetical protein